MDIDVPQRHNRVEGGGFMRRIETEKDANNRADAEGQQDRAG